MSLRAEGIERQPADGSFDAALAQFFHDSGTELAAETFVREIPSGPDEERKKRDKEEASPARGHLLAPRPTAVERPGRASFFHGMKKDRRHRC